MYITHATKLMVIYLSRRYVQFFQKIKGCNFISVP